MQGETPKETFVMSHWIEQDSEKFCWRFCHNFYTSFEFLYNGTKKLCRSDYNPFRTFILNEYSFCFLVTSCVNVYYFFYKCIYFGYVHLHWVVYVIFSFYVFYTTYICSFLKLHIFKTARFKLHEWMCWNSTLAINTLDISAPL